MAYLNNIPNSTDLISNSQPQIKANFAAIDSGSTGTGIGFARNHITMTDSTNGGLHYRVDFYQNQSDPILSGFVSSVYPKLINDQSELCQINDLGVTQITSGALSIWKGGTGNSGVVTFSSSNLTLPNGMQMSYGQGTTSASSNVTVSFGFPNNLYSAQLTVLSTGAKSTAIVGWGTGTNKSSGSVYGLDFDTSNRIVTNFYWLALGN